uniref:7TM GPCR serpentine receptor class x (Srx) domain-containing protein n=1 Tax=Romanomermis culicivorax TaxID=13658 RepID=A0A915HXW4_ROMCU
MEKIPIASPIGMDKIQSAIERLIKNIHKYYFTNAKITHGKQEKKFQGVPFYRIALFMGVVDIGQLICGGLYSGLCCLVKFQMPFSVQKFNSSFLTMCWYTYTMLNHVLAVNRFVTVFWPNKVNDIFSYKITSILIALSFFHGFTWFSLNLLLDVYASFSVEDYSFMYDFTKSKSFLLVQLNGYEDIVHMALMIMWYTLIYIKLKMKKNQIISESIAHNNKKENKVLMQAMLFSARG